MLPLSPPTSRESAALAADPRPGCGQMATSWWRSGWRGIWLPFSGWIHCLALIRIWSSVILKLTDLDL